MNDTPYLDGLGFYHVEHEIVSDYEHPIAEFSQTIIFGGDAEVRIVCQSGNCIIEPIEHGGGGRRIIPHDVIEDILQILFRRRQIPDFKRLAH